MLINPVNPEFNNYSYFATIPPVRINPNTGRVTALSITFESHDDNSPSIVEEEFELNFAIVVENDDENEVWLYRSRFTAIYPVAHFDVSPPTEHG
jgi:hypothetical protein